MKDDSGFYAVFTEQGSSASQLIAAKIMDVISRLAGCAGQAADAVSAYTQVKMEDAHKLLKIPKSECPDIWIRLPRHKWPKSWSSVEDPVVPLERNLHGRPSAGLLWERQFEKILLKYDCEKVSNWERSFVHRQKELFLSVYVDVIKLTAKKQNINPMWNVLNNKLMWNAQKQRRWKNIFSLLCRWETIETVFRTIISVNQFSIYGAVSSVCDEYSTCQVRTGRPVRTEQSVTTPTPSIEIPAKENLLQKHKERVEKLQQPDRLIKIRTDAGFLKTAEAGQHSITKHTDEFSQFTETVACREYTLPRDAKSPERLDSREHQKLTRNRSHNQFTCKVNMEWKLELNL